jgi:hypothetical protein
VKAFHDFLRAAFARALGARRVDEQIELAHARPGPGGRLGFWPAPWKDGEDTDPSGLHYNCSTLRPGAERALGAEAVLTHLVVLDDVGDHPRSKAPLSPLLALRRPPHAVITTRRDKAGHTNNQAAFFIEPHRPEAARILVKAAAEAEWCDPGCSGGLRWARPPGSIKARGDGFIAALAVDNFAAPRITLDDLAALLGIEEIARRLIEEHNRGRRENRHTPRLPPAEIARQAMAAILNDLDRDDWVRLGLALKASCGDPPALSDSEGFALFDELSRAHPSYDQAETRRFWTSARPSKASFGTVAFFARACGWTAASQELVLGPIPDPAIVAAASSTICSFLVLLALSARGTDATSFHPPEEGRITARPSKTCPPK